VIVEEAGDDAIANSKDDIEYNKMKRKEIKVYVKNWEPLAMKGIPNILNYKMRLETTKLTQEEESNASIKG
jgi:hypothetical protein